MTDTPWSSTYGPPGKCRSLAQALCPEISSSSRAPTGSRPSQAAENSHCRFAQVMRRSIGRTESGSRVKESGVKSAPHHGQLSSGTVDDRPPGLFLNWLTLLRAESERPSPFESEAPRGRCLRRRHGSRCGRRRGRPGSPPMRGCRAPSGPRRPPRGAGSPRLPPGDRRKARQGRRVGPRSTIGTRSRAGIAPPRPRNRRRERRGRACRAPLPERRRSPSSPRRRRVSKWSGGLGRHRPPAPSPRKRRGRPRTRECGRSAGPRRARPGPRRKPRAGRGAGRTALRFAPRSRPETRRTPPAPGGKPPCGCSPGRGRGNGPRVLSGPQSSRRSRGGRPRGWRARRSWGPGMDAGSPA